LSIFTFVIFSLQDTFTGSVCSVLLSFNLSSRTDIPILKIFINHTVVDKIYKSLCRSLFHY